MEGVERTNAVVVRYPLQEQERREKGIRRDSYMMDVDRGRNCYSCERFGHLVENCNISWKIFLSGENWKVYLRHPNRSVMEKKTDKISILFL